MGWEDKVRRVQPYIPGEQPKDTEKVIKLNTNEMPYSPSPKATKALREFDADTLRLYPAADVGPLRDALAQYYKRSGDEVFVGVGSDDVLSVAFLTFFDSDVPILFPDITYSFYDVWADLYRIPYVTKPLDENFRINKADYMTENGGIVIANPNAPTGVSEMEDIRFIEDIVSANPDSVVIVDEAYVDFGGVSALPLIDKYDNVLIIRTFSKSRAFAGVRIGFAMGNSRLIGYMNDIKYSINSYTMNRPAIELGLAALSDEQYFAKTVQKIVSTRAWVNEELRARGFSTTDSKTNFVFVSPPKNTSAKTIFEELRKCGIYVRWWDKPRIRDWLRITVGTDEEMRTLISAIDDIIS